MIHKNLIGIWPVSNWDWNEIGLHWDQIGNRSVLDQDWDWDWIKSGFRIWILIGSGLDWSIGFVLVMDWSETTWLHWDFQISDFKLNKAKFCRFFYFSWFSKLSNCSACVCQKTRSWLLFFFALNCRRGFYSTILAIFGDIK